MRTEHYLVQIEFRYTKTVDFSRDVLTVAVCETFDDAVLSGNRALEYLESRYELHTFPDGSKPKNERFSVHGGPFGTKKVIVSNMAYLNTPFTFYATITTLKYSPINEVIDRIEQHIMETP